MRVENLKFQNYTIECYQSNNQSINVMQNSIAQHALCTRATLLIIQLFIFIFSSGSSYPTISSHLFHSRSWWKRIGMLAFFFLNRTPRAVKAAFSIGSVQASSTVSFGLIIINFSLPLLAIPDEFTHKSTLISLYSD